MSANEKFGRGAVVQCPVPNQEDRSKFTYRTAVVLSDDGVNCDLLICPTTSSVNQAHRYSYSFVVLKNSAEGKAMCLAYDSLIMADRTGKIPRSVIKRYRNGQAPESILAKIDELRKQMKIDADLSK
jgi:mRNA-degrading endonuclease toxin of MazEF toxin-antitoxin module